MPTLSGEQLGHPLQLRDGAVHTTKFLLKGTQFLVSAHGYPGHPVNPAILHANVPS